ncbi:uncharacterized protein LOC127009443 [Eriocheir sinensis]|uniref:uncharacterized protein LOC127009443 n=1 Tax=Eriocheir sinensis TaxID=95602 RepID=UPI0021C7BFA9|nr:uncharacterized protein LOC127009443 [Eriocheir sinensis]
MSTRIVNMQCELRLPPLVERIYSNVTRLTVKCLHLPHLSPHYSQLIRMSLGPARPVPPILPAGRTLIRAVSSLIRSLDLDVRAADVPPGPPPWMLPTPEVSLTPTSKSDPPPLQLQLALEHVATVTSSIAAPRRLYTDGSLQSDGAAGCAVFSPDLEPPPGGWVGRRLHDHSSSTLSDRLAKEACCLPPRGDARPLSLPCNLSRVRSAAFLPARRRRDTEKPHSITINHYEAVCRHKYSYRRRGLMVRRHNVVSARLRLGYRPPWQVAGVEGEPVFTECRLCRSPLSNTIEHYCLACPTVRGLLPQGQPLDAVCRHLLNHDSLDVILVRHPRFGGFS